MSSQTIWDFFLKLQKKNINIKGEGERGGEGGGLRKPSIFVINWDSLCLSFFLNASTTTTYIFIAPTYTTTTITLQPYALSVKF